LPNTTQITLLLLLLLLVPLLSYVVPATAGDGPDAAAGPYLSLPRLQLWLDEPLRRMRLLAALVDSCRGSGGGLLAGGVWAATNVGDPLARSYAVRILHQVRDVLLLGVLAVCTQRIAAVSSSKPRVQLQQQAVRGGVQGFLACTSTQLCPRLRLWDLFIFALLVGNCMHTCVASERTHANACCRCSCRCVSHCLT
jgi:hypothetical protein